LRLNRRGGATHVGELTSMAIRKWFEASGVTWHYIAPGKPTAERSRGKLHIGRLRDKCLL
jgi:hypothetical protein